MKSCQVNKGNHFRNAISHKRLWVMAVLSWLRGVVFDMMHSGTLNSTNAMVSLSYQCGIGEAKTDVYMGKNEVKGSY